MTKIFHSKVFLTIDRFARSLPSEDSLSTDYRYNALVYLAKAYIELSKEDNSKEINTLSMLFDDIIEQRALSDHVLDVSHITRYGRLVYNANENTD